MVKKIYVDGDFEDWSSSDWEDYVEEKAEKIAEQRIKQNRKYGQAPKEGDKEKYVAEYKRRMLKAYPFDKFNDEVYAAFQNMGDESGMKWLDGWKDMDPMATQERIKFKKHIPLLQGIASEGDDWYSMGMQKLKDIGGEMGYKTGTQEGFKKFLDNLSKYQTQYDRAKLVEEYRDKRNPLEALAYPMRTKAIEESIANGTDPNIGALSALDAVADLGQFMAPSLNVLKARPVLNSVLDAGIQGGIELGRQGLGSKIGNVEADYVEAPITALTAGLTRPAMFGTVQGAMGGLTGPNWMSFRRGMMGSTRAGNPVVAERNALAKSIDDFNDKVAESIAVENKIGSRRGGVNYGEGLDTFMNLAKKNIALRANLPAKLSEELGIDRIAKGNVGRPVYLDKQAILDAYDKINPQVGVNVKNGVTTVIDELPDHMDGMDPKIFMGGKKESTLRGLIPNKFADLEDRNSWYNAGMNIGSFVNSLGGRVEPTFKINPFNIKEDKEGYKNTGWYKKLSPKSKAIVDEAFKKKEEELEVDLLEEE